MRMTLAYLSVTPTKTKITKKKTQRRNINSVPSARVITQQVLIIDRLPGKCNHKIRRDREPSRFQNHRIMQAAQKGKFACNDRCVFHT